MLVYCALVVHPVSLRRPNSSRFPPPSSTSPVGWVDHSQRAERALVPEHEGWILGPALVVAQVVVLGHVLEAQGLAVAGEAEQGLEQRHVQVDVVAQRAVVAGWGGGAVNGVLHHVVLRAFDISLGFSKGLQRGAGRGGEGAHVEHVQIDCFWPAVQRERGR